MIQILSSEKQNSFLENKYEINHVGMQLDGRFQKNKIPFFKTNMKLTRNYYFGMW